MCRHGDLGLGDSGTQGRGVVEMLSFTNVNKSSQSSQRFSFDFGLSSVGLNHA